jgi:hypothetical protein
MFCHGMIHDYGLLKVLSDVPAVRMGMFQAGIAFKYHLLMCRLTPAHSTSIRIDSMIVPEPHSGSIAISHSLAIVPNNPLAMTPTGALPKGCVHSRGLVDNSSINLAITYRTKKR